MRSFAIIALGLALSACMVGPDYQRPNAPEVKDWNIDLEGRSLDGPSLAEQKWFDIFKDEQLREVVLEALEQNKALLIAVEKIVESRAVHRIVRSALYPSLDLALRGEREHESDLTNTNARRVDTLFFGPTARWELDLWGKNRRAGNAAYASYLATEYGAQAVRLSLISEVSRAYFQLQGVESRLSINYSTVDAREQALVIAQKRFRGGLTSKLEVKQAEVELASARASTIRRSMRPKRILARFFVHSK